MTYTVSGIDISKWQDPATDGANMDGCEFVGIRACYGALPYTVRRADGTVATVQPQDSAYAAHEANARAHGAVVIAYCFGRSQDGARQADMLLATAPHADLYALDLEGDGSAPAMTASQASAFLARMHAVTPKKCGLYHSESGFPTGLGEAFRWVAKWGAVPPTGTWAFWQWQGSPLDRDWFNGTLDQLKAMAGLTVAAPNQPVYPASLGQRPATAKGWITVDGGTIERWVDPTHKVAVSGRHFTVWAYQLNLLDHGKSLPGYRVVSPGSSYRAWTIFAGPGVAWHAL